MLPRLLRVLFSESIDLRSQQYFHMKFHPSRNALEILLKILSCLSVKTHLHCFRKWHLGIQLFSMVLWVARIEVSLAAALNCLANFFLLKAFTSPIVGEAAFGAHLDNLWQHWNCVLICNQFICPRSLLYLAIRCWSAMEIFFCDPIYWDLLQFFNSLFLANLNAWSWLKIHDPMNSLSCKEHVIPFFWTNLDLLSCKSA